MKVLVNRTWYFLSSALVFAADKFKWSVRYEYELFVHLCKYLRINRYVDKHSKVTMCIDWNKVNQFNFRNLIPLLSASCLRSLIKLSEYILKRPEYFDIFIVPRYSISIQQFEQILCQGSPNLNKIGCKTGLIGILW